MSGVDCSFERLGLAEVRQFEVRLETGFAACVIVVITRNYISSPSN